jgi:hypothetical protein
MPKMTSTRPLTEHIRYYTVPRPTLEIKRILSIDESVQEL